MAARNVDLTAQLNAFVDEEVGNGRHQNASEVVREALRRYQDDVAAENERRGAIRAVIREGREAIAQGEFTAVRDPADTEALLGRLARRGRVRGSGTTGRGGHFPAPPSGRGPHRGLAGKGRPRVRRSRARPLTPP